METKRVEIQIEVSQNYNANWRKLWDILLRPPQEKPGTENTEPKPTPPADTLPEKPKKSKPQQLSLFTLDNSKLERDDPGTG